MFVSMKANKKRMVAFVVLAAVVVAAVLFLRWQKGEEPAPQQFFGETGEERMAFLTSFGWEVDAQASEQREVMIPAEFDDVYQAYNAMQQAQGFDLAPYAGEVVTQYKYHITNYPGEPEVYATLLVYGRLIIGGDLACAQVDGFMHGFAKDSARYGEAAPQSTPESAPAATPESAATPTPCAESAPESAATPEPPAESTAAQPEEAPGEEQAQDQAEGAAADPDWPTD